MQHAGPWPHRAVHTVKRFYRCMNSRFHDKQRAFASALNTLPATVPQVVSAHTQRASTSRGANAMATEAM